MNTGLGLGRFSAPALTKGYVDGPFGQIHYLEARGATDRPPLVCLHATAYSAESMRPFVGAFDGDRRVIALDTPGYGGSDRPSEPASIEAYGAAVAQAIKALAPEPVDLFGYHTGVSIGVEAALQTPGLVRRMALVGVPYFNGPDRAEWRERLVVRHALGTQLSQFQERWDYLVTDRPEGMALERGFANFVDELRAWPNGWWAHRALFEHDLGARLDELVLPVMILNLSGALAEKSREAASRLRDCRLVEMPGANGAIFEKSPDELAARLRAFLD